jgi:hypothetical protein
MPVIAINVSKKVYDFYHGMKKGKRSMHFNNILERHCRIFEKGHSAKSQVEMETALQQQIQAKESLQSLVLELNQELEKKNRRSLWNLLFG